MLQARVPNPHLIGLLGRSYLIMNNPLYWFMFKLSVPHGIANEDVIPQNPGELSCKVKESSFFTDNFFFKICWPLLLFYTLLNALGSKD